jgi:hypothetical protein
MQGGLAGLDGLDRRAEEEYFRMIDIKYDDKYQRLFF